MESYCLTCKKKVEVINVVVKDSKTGKYAQGNCRICGRVVLKKLRKEDW